MIRRPELIADALRAYTNAPQPEQVETQKTLRAELDALDAKEKATAQAQVDALTKGRNVDVYDGLFNEIDARRKALKAQLIALQAQETAESMCPKDEAGKVAQAMSDVELVLKADDLDPAIKNRVLRRVIQSVSPDWEDVEARLLPPQNDLTVPG